MIFRRFSGRVLPAVSYSYKPRFEANRSFRSDAALEAIANALEEKVPNLVLYNYPSFSGAFSALFAHRYHSRLLLPCLILPYSSIVPFRVEDLCLEGFKRCYLLDFAVSKDFACRSTACEIICFDHRNSAFTRIGSIKEEHKKRLKIKVDTEVSSSKAVYKYFSSKLIDQTSSEVEAPILLSVEDEARIESVLDYIEDIDLRRWRLPDIKAFSFGLQDWRSRINCITNPYMYEQLLKMSSEDLIAYGNSYLSSRLTDAKKVLKLNKVSKIRLGRGLYGECLGIRADGNTQLSDELGKLLSLQSSVAGLRPIGAVTYMQRNNLKMCLRSTDDITDTSEVAKAYGGGGTSSSSSFIIRMDEYNQWISTNPP
ncbi:hypothetical protein CARUB_v10013995mg [Capsella rubella]|uniref:Uncharacterized protein n=2 Tax=Capsella rubella TaxID=81985 RepID=R0G5M2_9BRAS|nr:uncharacterized protein LOC17891973 isoform X2 [Capsella rubella]XP_023642260.1 uncharacterized protein LOC17891973 isoform X2 [Capsella rubella]XP_023642261.1 uncharacterized protein LOC17891973 isoform X2 [Capsella rubella]EOA30852.1 hypothetical protein CARUB_v10013995mg [Capsella rubella]